MTTTISTAPELKKPGPPAAAATVVSLYDVLDFAPGCGIIDFTDGKYVEDRHDRAGYEEAQARQAEYLLDEIECRPGSRILDIGCGYGRILEAAAARGATATGITISAPQVEAGRRRGLDVQLCNYRELVEGGAHPEWKGAFDGLVANGSLEHFVQTEDAAAGRTEEIYTGVLRNLPAAAPARRQAGDDRHSLAIRRAGQAARIYWPGEPRGPRGALNYHAADLHESFGGWYPTPGQLERCAEGCFRLIAAEDGTHDYWLTSEYWVRQIKRSLVTNPRSWPAAVRTFARRPRDTWRVMRCLLWDESWNYQFREPAPAQLWRHTWAAV